MYAYVYARIIVCESHLSFPQYTFSFSSRKETKKLPFLAFVSRSKSPLRLMEYKEIRVLVRGKYKKREGFSKIKIDSPKLEEEERDIYVQASNGNKEKGKNSPRLKSDDLGWKGERDTWFLVHSSL